MARLNPVQRNSIQVMMLIVLTLLSSSMAQQEEVDLDDQHDEIVLIADEFGNHFPRTHDNDSMHVAEGYEDGAERRSNTDGEAQTRQYHEPALPNRDGNEPGKHEDIREPFAPVHPRPTEDNLPSGVSEDSVESPKVFSNLNEDVPNGADAEDIDELKDLGCPDIEVPLEKPAEKFVWNKIEKRNIVSFSAYYDERVEVGGPLVRVLSNGQQQKFHHKVAPLYCVLIFPARKQAVSVRALYKSLFETRAYPNEYTGHWIECPIPELEPILVLQSPEHLNVPIAVTVVPEPCGPEPAFWLPVHTRKVRKDPEPRIALCTPLLYDAADWLQIAEWIILHKLLGYSTVYLYVIPQTRNMEKLQRMLDAFEKLRVADGDGDGDLRIVKVGWEVRPECHTFCHNAEINECLYRAGLDHDYVTIANQDELLIPLKRNTMKALITELESSNTAAYMFQHIMFDHKRVNKLTLDTIQALSGVDLSELNTIDITQFQPWTLTWKRHMSEPYPAQKLGSKTLYNVNRTVSADIHCPLELVTSYKEVLVAPHDGVVYHYEKRAPKRWLKGRAYEYGSRVEKYQAQLLREMIRLLKHLEQETEHDSYGDHSKY